MFALNHLNHSLLFVFHFVTAFLLVLPDECNEMKYCAVWCSSVYANGSPLVGTYNHLWLTFYLFIYLFVRFSFTCFVKQIFLFCGQFRIFIENNQIIY